MSRSEIKNIFPSLKQMSKNIADTTFKYNGFFGRPKKLIRQNREIKLGDFKCIIFFISLKILDLQKETTE